MCSICLPAPQEHSSETPLAESCACCRTLTGTASVQNSLAEAILPEFSEMLAKMVPVWCAYRGKLGRLGPSALASQLSYFLRTIILPNARRHMPRYIAQ